MSDFDYWFRGFCSGLLIGSSLTCIVIALFGVIDK
jgi:hypothetical protein